MTDILERVDGAIMTLTFDRVPKKNAITRAMYTALADGLERAAQDAAVRVVVLQGHAEIFTAGNDIADFQQDASAGATARGEQPVWRFLHALATFPKPLIASVCGPAVGVGTTLLLHCDLVYAGDNAVFSLPFVNLGVVPEAASSLLLPRLLGHQRAAAALLMGDPITVDLALEAGLVNRVVPPSECNAVAAHQAQRLAAKPLVSLVQTKRLMKGALQTEVLARMEQEADVFERLLRGPAAREAFAAFMEGRAPDFSALDTA